LQSVTKEPNAFQKSPNLVTLPVEQYLLTSLVLTNERLIYLTTAIADQVNASFSLQKNAQTQKKQNRKLKPNVATTLLSQNDFKQFAGYCCLSGTGLVTEKSCPISEKWTKIFQNVDVRLRFSFCPKERQLRPKTLRKIGLKTSPNVNSRSIWSHCM